MAYVLGVALNTFFPFLHLSKKWKEMRIEWEGNEEGQGEKKVMRAAESPQCSAKYVLNELELKVTLDIIYVTDQWLDASR
jgi:hypothetical protein